MSENEPKIAPVKERKPEWLKVRLPSGPDFENYKEIDSNLKKKNLFTVCQEASCPNIGECWSKKTATMMILGDTCTRACKFCDVKTGNPKGFINTHEIEQASEMVKIMSLKYIVVTSVDRDDLLDYGASHFANVVKRIHEDHPKVVVEVLNKDLSVV